MIYRIVVVVCILGLGLSTTYGYIFGLKSADNSVENIITIEKKHNIQIPIVSLIFDPRDDNAKAMLNAILAKYGSGTMSKILHLTLSPNVTAKEVAEGKFDKQYTEFFQKIHNANIPVIFRTMHEMNGGRYPRASDPENFKKAWIHIWQLSRKLGLSTDKIAFDFSVNHYDMPTTGSIPNQKSLLIECNQLVKYEKKCFTFEDYYPGDRYVDLIGFTFYNRGKATSNRLWYTPDRILNDKKWLTMERVKSFGKPVIIDEMGTTAVTYTGAYDPQKSLEIYKTEYQRKNIWLNQLKDFLVQEPLIVGAIYFNVDYTNGLEYPLVGEADRSIFNLSKSKTYYGGFDLANAQEKLDTSHLYNVFGLRAFKLGSKSILVKQKYYYTLQSYLASLLKKYSTKKDMIAQVKKAKSENKNSEMVYLFDKILEILG